MFAGRLCSSLASGNTCRSPPVHGRVSLMQQSLGVSAGPCRCRFTTPQNSRTDPARS